MKPTKNIQRPNFIRIQFRVSDAEREHIQRLLAACPAGTSLSTLAASVITPLWPSEPTNALFEMHELMQSGDPNEPSDVILILNNSIRSGLFTHRETLVSHRTDARKHTLSTRVSNHLWIDDFIDDSYSNIIRARLLTCDDSMANGQIRFLHILPSLVALLHTWLTNSAQTTDAPSGTSNQIERLLYRWQLIGGFGIMPIKRQGETFP